MSKKECTFTSKALADHITNQFCEITGISKDNILNGLVRSERMVRFDMKNWGYKWKNNKKRPFFEGHERDDVVKHRSEFIDYKLNRKDHYWTVDPETNEWIAPIEKPCLEIFHDEASNASNEQSPMRWVKEGAEPFISKGRGRSIMTSDFLIAHPSGSTFSLSEEEWKNATEKYPSLLDDHGINYEPRTCIGSIVPGREGYFDSEAILNQFERLFQMLQFKKAYHYPVPCDIEVIVDNARTHTAQTLNINDYRLNIGKSCPLEYIVWKDDNENEHTLDLFFKDGPNKGLSKGLRQIAIELGFEISPKAKLVDIKALVVKHPAFSSSTKLEALGNKYGVKIIFLPKFHCELNPIEGKWCLEKGYVRKRSNQKFDRMISLIKEAREYFQQNNDFFTRKLLKRHWNVLIAYKTGATYGQVLKTYSGGKTQENVLSHRKFYETFLKLQIN